MFRKFGRGKKKGNNILGIVNPEKIRVENRLDHAGEPRDRIDIALCKVSIQPIGYVQRPIKPQREQIVRRDRFGFARSLQHEQLGENGDGFQPYRESP